MTGKRLISVAHSITFMVAGEPQPQGSTRAFVVAGKAVTTSANVRLSPWRGNVTLAAVRAGRGMPLPFTGAISVECQFAIRRPRTVTRLWPSTRPDLDKLQRAVGDSLVDAGILLDDGQIVVWHPSKLYVDDPTCPLGHPGALVTVIALEPQ